MFCICCTNLPICDAIFWFKYARPKLACYKSMMCAWLYSIPKVSVRKEPNDWLWSILVRMLFTVFLPYMLFTVFFQSTFPAVVTILWDYLCTHRKKSLMPSHIFYVTGFWWHYLIAPKKTNVLERKVKTLYIITPLVMTYSNSLEKYWNCSSFLVSVSKIVSRPY